MTDALTTGPVLFCYDGSHGSRNAMKAAGDLIGRPVDVVVLTVWETIATRLALAGAFTAGLTTGGADLNEEEATSARAVAEEGARRCQRSRLRRLSADQGVLRRHCQYDPGGGGHHLRPPYRLRPARSRTAPHRPARQCLPPAGLTRQTSCPDRPRTRGITNARSARRPAGRRHIWGAGGGGT